ncbi:MAG TPA: peptide-methionine (R)-S-oxide reductase, partial [Isosphaeraceae bacterium]|nr:peptide-methionine (R)-S-oxide reductase [Isosphaeraceae bacterium]
MKSAVAIFTFLAACVALGCAQELAGADDTPKSEPEEPTGKVVKSNEEWAQLLTRPQFMVTRMKATEPAFSGKYVHTKVRGTFACV